MDNKVVISKAVTSESVIEEITKLVGRSFPLSVTVVGGKVTEISYSTSWKSGGTTPVEKEDGTIEYEENYVEESLTKSEIEKLNSWVKKNTTK